jgi:hypothetical protein
MSSLMSPDPSPMGSPSGSHVQDRALPDDVLGLIKEYSRPIGTRLDWRTCKRNESRRIKGSNLALLLWYEWFINGRQRKLPLFDEVKSWTFYGRRHLIYESRIRFWTQDPQDGYESQFVEAAQEGWPVLLTDPYIENPMGEVSLIV